MGKYKIPTNFAFGFRMRLFVFIAAILLAGFAGFFIGKYSGDKKIVVAPSDTKLVTEYVYDTIIEKERIEVPVLTDELDSNFQELDSLKDELIRDTVQQKIIERDTSHDEEITINKDEFLGSKRVKIQYLNKPSNKDSLMKEMLGIKNHLPTDLSIQFWESPINFVGYKLSHNTLVVYGLPEQFEYEVYAKDQVLYLSNEAFFYQIKETHEFKPFKEVEKNIILND